MPRRAGALITGWATLFLIGWGAGALVTDAAPGFDLSLVRSLHAPRTGAWTAFMRAVTWLGSPVWLDVVFGIGLAALLLARLWLPALFLVLASPGTVLLTQTLKPLVDRHRPPVAHLTSASGPSFPSGHAASTTALYGALLLIALSLPPFRTGGMRRALIGAVVVMLALVGLSRVVLGVHYPTDVIAGWLLPAAWLALVWGTLLAPAPRLWEGNR